KLRYTIEHRKGVALPAGGHGVGKTYLSRRLADELVGDAYHLVTLVYPSLSAGELLRDIAIRLGAEVCDADNPGNDAVLRTIEHRLCELAARLRHTVLVIDEAHLLEAEQLQALQLLLNFQE